ncbi:MAG: hypothetical protein ACKVOL_03300 [Novosphingobium sp.]
MAYPASSGTAPRAIEALLADDLSRAREAVANVIPILRHLLRSDDTSIFSDEIIARVRGMFLDIARQVIIALAEAAGHAQAEAWAHKESAELAHMLADNPAFLEHFHALALEWQWTERLAENRTHDPVLSPLLQALMASGDPEVSAAAMNLLAAQARFGQYQRRMQLPLGELPGDLLHMALVTMRAYVGTEGSADAYALIAERNVRGRFDETRGRLGLMHRVLDAMGDGVNAALTLDQAGIALFLSALARGSGQTREAVIMATVDSQLPRLALALRASGLGPEPITSALVALYPDAVLPAGIEALEADQAAALLTSPAAAP